MNRAEKFQKCVVQLKKISYVVVNDKVSKRSSPKTTTTYEVKNNTFDEIVLTMERYYIADNDFSHDSCSYENYLILD